MCVNLVTPQQEVAVAEKSRFGNRPEISDETIRIVRETWKFFKVDITRVGVVVFTGYV